MFTSEKPLFEFSGPFQVPVQITPSILLLILLYLSSAGGDVIGSVMFLLIVLASILLHEIGHAWGAMIQGVPVRRVVLNGCGGFCEYRTSVSRYQQELIVAMGPIVNLTLWAVFSLLLPLVNDPQIWRLVWMIVYVNGALSIINLLPITPLDGSKLLHLGLARVLPMSWAHRVCGAAGLAVAFVCLAILALYVVIDPIGTLNWWLIVALMVLIPALPAHWGMLTKRVA